MMNIEDVDENLDNVDVNLDGSRLRWIRFAPTGLEIIRCYLEPLLQFLQNSQPEVFPYIMPTVIQYCPALYNYNHIALTEQYSHNRRGYSWFFWTTLVITNPHRSIFNRGNTLGTWRFVLNSRKYIESNGATIGVMEQFSFYEGRGAQATNTGWLMEEYKKAENSVETVICRLSGPIEFYQNEPLPPA